MGDVLGKCSKQVKAEWSKENLKLIPIDTPIGIDKDTWPKVFGHDADRFTGRWNCLKSFEVYLGLRCTLFATMLGVLLYSFGLYAEDGDSGYWFIYLTHWGLLIEVVYLGLAVWTTKQSPSWEFLTENEREILPLSVRILWPLGTIVLPTSFMIFAMYWGLVFKWEKAPKAISVLTHGVNFVVMIIDQVVTGRPILLLHVIYFWIFAVVYVVWSGLHYWWRVGNEDGDDYIYSSLDWSQGSKTGKLSIGILFIVAPAIYVTFWACFTLKNSQVAPAKDEPTGSENDAIQDSSIEEKSEPPPSMGATT